MSFIEHLTKEHREIEKWIRTIREADEQNKNREDLKAMFQQLHVHMKMEEECLYPTLKNELSCKEEVEIIEDSIQEHGEAKDIMIKFLGDDDLSMGEIDELLERLLAGLEHHHHDEETKLFPMCKERIVTARIDQISDEIMAFERANDGQFQPADLQTATGGPDEEKTTKEDPEKAPADSNAAGIGAEPVETDASKIGATPVKPDAAKIGA